MNLRFLKEIDVGFPACTATKATPKAFVDHNKLHQDTMAQWSSIGGHLVQQQGRIVEIGSAKGLDCLRKRRRSPVSSLLDLILIVYCVEVIVEGI